MGGGGLGGGGGGGGVGVGGGAGDGGMRGGLGRQRRVVLLVLLYTNMLHVFGMVANNYNAL